jgi:hypothetical protein
LTNFEKNKKKKIEEKITFYVPWVTNLFRWARRGSWSGERLSSPSKKKKINLNHRAWEARDFA